MSDRVGAGHDLLLTGQNGYLFPCGNVAVLMTLLRKVFSDRERLEGMKRAAQRRMETWSPRQNIEGLVQAVERATLTARGRAA